MSWTLLSIVITSALSAVFSGQKIAISKKLQCIELYYNVIEDFFAFKGEIDNLDDTWIDLKDTYNPLGDNYELLQSFEQKLRSIPHARNQEIERKILLYKDYC